MAKTIVNKNQLPNLKTINNNELWGDGDIELATKDNTYTKTEVDNALNLKADKATTYTKTEVDNALNLKANSADLATVATSGNYNDLSNKPSIPTKTSDLTNDSGFITKDVNDLTNYTLTSNLGDLATKDTVNYETEVTNKPTIPSIEGLASETFVTNAVSTHNSSNTAHSSLFSAKQDTISDLATIRSNASLGATALQKTDVVNNVTTTTTDVPLSANMGKELQTEISNLKNIGRFLSILDASAGTVSSQPQGSVGTTYTYKVGDYYRIGASGTYFPKNTLVFTVDSTSGSSNFETGSTTLEIGDVIYCSNVSATATTWVIQVSSGGGTVQDVQINGTSLLSGGIANIPYASSSNAGVIKTYSQYATSILSTGQFYATTKTYSDYTAGAEKMFVGKGTLENVITGKNFETADNKSDSYTTSSSTTYASTKALVDGLETKIDGSKLINATIVGSPTISGYNVSGFSSANYLTTPSAFNVSSSDNWEINFKIKTGTDISSWQQPFSLSSTNFKLFILFKGDIQIRLADGNGTVIQYFFGPIAVANTEYIFSIKYNNGILDCGLSSGSWGTYSGNIDFNSTILLGKSEGGSVFLGKIYLQEQSYIKINNNLWWSGVKDCEDVLNKVTSISSSSTDTQYPSAKCVYDLVGNIEATLQAIRGV